MPTPPRPERRGGTAEYLPVHGSMSHQPGMRPRVRVLVEGRISEVRLQPIGALPRYEAEVEIRQSLRTVVSAQTKAARGSFAAPTSAIAMDTPELSDAPGPLAPGARVRLIWHGQRSVPGLDAGTRLRCSGMLARDAVGPVIYNPRYEIVSRHTP